MNEDQGVITYYYPIPYWRSPEYVDSLEEHILGVFNGLKLEPIIAN